MTQPISLLSQATTSPNTQINSSLEQSIAQSVTGSASGTTQQNLVQSVTGSAPTGSTDLLSALSDPTQRNAYEAVQSLLDSYGLGSLANNLLNYAQNGYDSQTAYILLQQTPEWKQRFQGNEIRRQNGLAVLDPAHYLDLERQYSNVLQAYGIPQGMYGMADFARWIGNSVSPTEISSRAQLAAQAVYSADPYFKAALSQFHGIDTGHLIAYFLDNNKALPYLQQQSQAAQIGAAALRNHLGFDEGTALTLASMGITQDQAEKGYSQIAQQLPRLSQLAQMSGTTFGQQQAEQATLFGNAAAQRQQQQLIATEAARFGGSSGVGSSLYHPDYGVAQNLQGQY